MLPANDVHTTLKSQSQSVHLYSALPVSRLSANRNVFSRRLKAAWVACGLRTGYGRLFQADGPAVAKAWRPYVLSRWLGTEYSSQCWGVFKIQVFKI